ncbi:MAG: TatD family hydrolase [Acidobacteriota bacterium]
MDYIDFHCHLDSSDFSENRSEIINNIFNSGVSTIVSVADPYEENSHEITRKIAEENENLFIMTAAHPHNAKDYSSKVEEKILDLSLHSKSIGIGEAGLDFHYNLSPPDIQREVFRRQIGIAKEVGKPLILHSREAESEIISILEEERFDLPVVFHCYTGDLSDAKEIIARGYYISISGIVTFKKAEFLREIVEMLPLNRIFSETDSPYLSPEPFRGKTNDPSRVKIVADRIAGIKGITPEELNKAIRSNLNSIQQS